MRTTNLDNIRKLDKLLIKLRSESKGDDDCWQAVLSKIERELKEGGRRKRDSRPNWRRRLPYIDSPTLLRANINSALNKFLSPSLVEVLNSQVIMNVLKKLRSTGRIPQLNPALGGNTPAASILCLGLGNPGSSKLSLNQFAFLKALVQLSEGSFLPESTFFYDPLIIKDSRDLIREQGFRILSSNQEGEYALPRDKNTFVFLPFTPFWIRENLIGVNWYREVLNRVVFLATPVEPQESLLDLPTPHLDIIKPYQKVADLDATFDNFSTLQIQWFEIPAEEALKKPPNAPWRQKIIECKDNVFIDEVHEGEVLVDEIF